jgi:hypothetical protein
MANSVFINAMPVESQWIVKAMSIIKKAKKKQVKNRYVPEGPELDPYYRKVQDEQDKGLAFLIPLIMSSAVAITVDLLNSEQQSVLSESLGIMPGMEVQEDKVQDNVPVLDIILQDPKDDDVKNIVNEISDQDLQTAMQIGNEVRSDWLVSDERTAENIDVKNIQNIMDQAGMFGSIEAQKGASLESYQLMQQSQGMEVWMPWTTVGDDDV